MNSEGGPIHKPKAPSEEGPVGVRPRRVGVPNKRGCGIQGPFLTSPWLVSLAAAGAGARLVTLRCVRHTAVKAPQTGNKTFVAGTSRTSPAIPGHEPIGQKDRPRYTQIDNNSSAISRVTARTTTGFSCSKVTLLDHPLQFKFRRTGSKPS